jgi:hypothetical protein
VPVHSMAFHSLDVVIEWDRNIDYSEDSDEYDIGDQG